MLLKNGICQVTEEVRTEQLVQRIRQTLAEKMEHGELPPHLYTYPTKGAYESFSDGRLAASSWSSVKGPVNLYIHIPYCDMKCSFCTLFSTAGHSANTIERYLKAIIRELDLLGPYLHTGDLEVKSICFGGGTPTVLSSEQISLLMDQFRSRFKNIDPNAEVCIEAAPNSMNDAQCRELRASGFNRISIGIQSFDDEELTGMGRLYDGDHGRRMVHVALEAGFPNVNIDLIYGLPNQTYQKWLRNLQTAIELGTPSITLYPLAVRSKTTYNKWYKESPGIFRNNLTKYNWYDVAVDLLTSNGYEQQTLVNFAREGGGSRHETNEFMGIPTIGLGSGARSYAPTLHYTNDDYVNRKYITSMISDYLNCIESSDEIPVRSAVSLDREEIIRKYVILRLLRIGVDITDFELRFGESLESKFGPLFDALRLENLVERSGRTEKLTKRGLRFSSIIATMFFSDRVKRLAPDYS